MYLVCNDYEILKTVLFKSSLAFYYKNSKSIVIELKEKVMKIEALNKCLCCMFSSVFMFSISVLQVYWSIKYFITSEQGYYVFTF